VAGQKWGGAPHFSSDDGLSFQLGTVPSNNSADTIFSLGTNPVTGDIYLGCELATNYVWKSTDNGRSFAVQCGTGGGAYGGNVIAFGFNALGHVFAATNGLYMSTDGCMTWAAVTGLQPYSHTSGGNVFALDNYGNVYFGQTYAAGASTLMLTASSDNGITFSQWIPNLPIAATNNGGISALLINNVDGFIYVAVSSKLIYKTKVQTPLSTTITTSFSSSSSSTTTTQSTSGSTSTSGTTGTTSTSGTTGTTSTSGTTGTTSTSGTTGTTSTSGTTGTTSTSGSSSSTTGSSGTSGSSTGTTKSNSGGSVSTTSGSSGSSNPISTTESSSGMAVSTICYFLVVLIILIIGS